MLIAVATIVSLFVGPETSEGVQLARHAVDVPAPTAARAQSRLIYLNRTGVPITPGENDARANRSSLPSQAATIPAWDAPPALWAETVACLEGMFAPFDVTFTESDPGATPHIEAVFGGTSALLGLPPRIGGVAPFASSCNVVENAMVFTFTETLIQNAQVVCEVQAQEIAHAYGLDHELLPSDPMSYLRYDGERAFQNESAACGETTARPCGVGATSCRANQNSYAILLERLGAFGAPPDPIEPVTPAVVPPMPDDTGAVGCSASRDTSGDVFGLALLAAMLIRRRR